MMTGRRIREVIGEQSSAGVRTQIEHVVQVYQKCGSWRQCERGEVLAGHPDPDMDSQGRAVSAFRSSFSLGNTAVTCSAAVGPRIIAASSREQCFLKRNRRLY